MNGPVTIVAIILTMALTEKTTEICSAVMAILSHRSGMDGPVSDAFMP